MSVLDLSLTDVRLGWSDCWQGGQRGGWTARRADKRAIVPLVKVKVAKGALRSREARTAAAKHGFRLRFLGRVSGARSQNANWPFGIFLGSATSSTYLICCNSLLKMNCLEGRLHCQINYAKQTEKLRTNLSPVIQKHLFKNGFQKTFSTGSVF